MQQKLCPTDVTDKQWAILSPLIPLAKTGDRPRRVNLREVVNGIFYIPCGAFIYAAMVRIMVRRLA